MEWEFVQPMPTKMSDISAPTVAAYGKRIHAMRPMEVILAMSIWMLFKRMNEIKRVNYTIERMQMNVKNKENDDGDRVLNKSKYETTTK